MGNDVKIGVNAVFDGSGVDAGVSAMANKIQQANKTQYTPVSDKAIKNIKDVNKAFEQLMRVDTDLKRRAKASGQSGANFESFNWESAYPNQANRAKKQHSTQNYVNNPLNHGGPSPNAPRGGSGGGFAANAAVGAAQAGLRAAGPAGSVAAGALGTGMSVGAGAGLMGLMGGMLALGVGKIVSSAMEKVTQAENNSVALDALKRTLGDVNVSFAALKSVVHSGADNLKITYDEAGRLSSQFVKLGNVSGEQYKSLAGELDVGVGMSRAFGMDPSQGMDALGQMRGIGVTNNTQDSRKFALLIGETIGKSDAFAKSGEVMDAITGFATSQTRNNVGVANYEGFAGMLSAMVGSKTPGMDVAGSTNMLAKIGASLSAGGAHGEASQFFTGMVGSRMGLDPIQTQIMREGGAFATNDTMFGPDSAAAKFGISGPKGGKSNLQGQLDLLREQYGSNKGMLAQATSNHLGIGINQAMGILNVKPNELGEMQKYADFGKMSGNGIGNMSKALFGTDADRGGIAKNLLGRSDVSKDDKAAIEAAMLKDTPAQKDMLAKMTAQYDQERTTGSDVRDSKNALDNIKTNMADKLVPLMTQMRHGIMSIAGGGTKSPMEIMRSVIDLESKDTINSIKGQYKDPLAAKSLEMAQQIKARSDGAGSMTPEQLRVADGKIKALSDEIVALNTKEAAAIKAELAERDKRLTDLKAQNAPVDAANGGAPSTPGGGGGSSGGSTAAASKGDTAAVMKFFMGKGWSESQAAGLTANLIVESGLKSGAVGDGGKAYGVAQWHPDRQADFKKWSGFDMRLSTREDQLGFMNYELTEGKEQAAGRKLKNTTTKGGAASAVSRYYERPKFADLEAAKRANIAESIGTPLPTDAGAGGVRGSAESFRSLMLQAEPIVIEHRNERGEQVRPSQQISVNVRQASPFGTERFA